MQDKNDVYTAQEELQKDNFDFAFELPQPQTETHWEKYYTRTHQNVQGENLLEKHVPSSYLLAVTEDNELVGRASIRHTLNERLRERFGHIGYAVLPQHRGKGYATEILKQSVIIARSLGVQDVLITCNEKNIASKTVIEKNGGVFDSVFIDEEDEKMLLFWIK